MQPSKHYEQLVQQGYIERDAQQQRLLVKLDALYEQLATPKGVRQRMRDSINRLMGNAEAPRGVYVWGTVGTGKSFLIDNFFSCLPFSDKLRMHFHNFMDVVHYSLKEYQGTRNPLRTIAADFARRTRLLCLDELIVNDIGDAMILAELFKHLLAAEVCLVFTSNIEPARLYDKGLQRQRFLPAIALIEAHCDVLSLSSGFDYRQRNMGHAKHYLTPLNDSTDAQMRHYFLQYSGNQSVSAGVVEIHKRPIDVIARSENVIWFDFVKICSVPRSQKDYLAISASYKTVLVSDMPKFGSEDISQALCFINFIDILYDRRVRLIISAACPIDQLYTRGRLVIPFTRTQSRLMEMQALDWGD
ncbi:MAG: cell division protein ZapE [Pseudomonadota bacterium]|nr:cell division protein ZapE [Pseudomonadota bacterium]